MSYARGGRDELESSQKGILVVGVAALAGFLFYEFVWKPGQAKAGPAQPSGPIQPGPGPGNLPGPSAGDSAAQGDTVLVSASQLAAVLGPASLPTSGDVEMVVTGASPGSPVVIAETTGAGGAPPGISAPVPRGAITKVVSKGGGAPAPPAPPGPIPGLPGVVPPTPLDLGDPLNLKQGHHYRARLELSPIETMFGNPMVVTSQFTAQGFTDVHAFAPDDKLPDDWPLMTAQNRAKNVWFVEGTWGGPDGSVPRPPQVKLVWEQ